MCLFFFLPPIFSTLPCLDKLGVAPWLVRVRVSDFENGEGGVGQTVAAPMASWVEEATRLARGCVPCGLAPRCPFETGTKHFHLPGPDQRGNTGRRTDF